MVKRKANLADAVHGAARADERLSARRRRRLLTRRATKGVLLRLPPKLHRQLRQLSLDEDTSLQALGVEALERMLEERQR